MITTAAVARDALADYAAWRAELVTVAKERHASTLAAFGGQASVEDLYPAELPPLPPRLAPLPRVDADSPPVAHFDGRRVMSVRPLQASIRPRWDVRNPLATGDNGVRVKRPAYALAAVVADLDHLATVAAVCGSLAVSCRAVGLTDRGAMWQAEADELAAFGIRHTEDNVPTLGAAFLTDWRALEARYGPTPTPTTRPSARPVSLRA